MEIKVLQRRVDNWIKKYGVRYYGELTNMVLLSEEVGELARLMARQYGDQSFKKSPETEKIQLAIADEMADIIFVLACLANQMEIDLEHAIVENFKKKSTRDHDRHLNNPKL